MSYRMSGYANYSRFFFFYVRLVQPARYTLDEIWESWIMCSDVYHKICYHSWYYSWEEFKFSVFIRHHSYSFKLFWYTHDGVMFEILELFEWTIIQFVMMDIFRILFYRNFIQSNNLLAISQFCKI